MTDLVIQGQTWAAMKEQALMLVKSGFLPDSIRTPEQAMAIAIKGYEIGMPMMQAFSQIHVIKGKPTISAEGMNALIRKNCPGAKLEILVNTNDRCCIRATRPGEASAEFTFTIEDARRAGITGNPSWAKYPDAMLFARCISVVARRVFPDCLSGISYTPEELGAVVSEEGEIIEVHAEKEIKAQAINPVTEDDDKYDPGNLTHKRTFAEKAAKFGVFHRNSLAALSDQCRGVQLKNLGAALSELLEPTPEITHPEDPAPSIVLESQIPE